MASGSFDRSFERVWESLPSPEQVTLLWDTDHWNSVGYRLVQNIKLKTVHLQELENQYILVCGRNRNAGYADTALMVRWDTPCCHTCWKRFPRG